MPTTVVGQIKGAQGENRIAPIVFVPLSGPMIDGNALITETVPEVKTRFGNGDFTVELEQGDYRVTAGDPETGQSTVTISVPNDELSHQFVDLIVEELTYAYPQPPQFNVPIATDGVAGIVKTDIAEGNPVVVTLTTINQMFSRVALFPSPVPAWVFNHTLGRDPIMVSVDENGERIYGDESFPSPTTGRIDFGANFAGKIIYI